MASGTVWDHTWTEHHVTPQYVAGLRRALLTQVPCFAIARVDVQQNDSTVDDNSLAHRLSLVPLPESLPTFTTRLVLRVDNTGRTARAVTSDDLLERVTRRYCLREHGLVPPVFLARLPPGHSLHAVCEVTRGTAEEHVRFQGVAAVTFSWLGAPANAETAPDNYGFVADTRSAEFRLQLVSPRCSVRRLKHWLEDNTSTACRHAQPPHKRRRVADHLDQSNTSESETSVRYIGGRGLIASDTPSDVRGDVSQLTSLFVSGATYYVEYGDAEPQSPQSPQPQEEGLETGAWFVEVLQHVELLDAHLVRAHFDTYALEVVKDEAHGQWWVTDENGGEVVHPIRRWVRLAHSDAL